MRAALSGVFMMVGCPPPPAVGDDGPSIEITWPLPGGTVTLNEDCVLDAQIVVHIEGLEVVPPPLPVVLVDGQGHWHGGPSLEAGYCIAWKPFCSGGDTPPDTYNGTDVLPGTATLFAALTDNGHGALGFETQIEVFLEEPAGGCPADR